MDGFGAFLGASDVADAARIHILSGGSRPVERWSGSLAWGLRTVDGRYSLDNPPLFFMGEEELICICLTPEFALAVQAAFAEQQRMSIPRGQPAGLQQRLFTPRQDGARQITDGQELLRSVQSSLAAGTAAERRFFLWLPSGSIVNAEARFWPDPQLLQFLLPEEVIAMIEQAWRVASRGWTGGRG